MRAKTFEEFLEKAFPKEVEDFVTRVRRNQPSGHLRRRPGDAQARSKDGSDGVGRKGVAMKIFFYELYCQDGGHGWGETGQLGWIAVEAVNELQAIQQVEAQIPGGWMYRRREIEETTVPTRTPGMNSSLTRKGLEYFGWRSRR